MNPFGNGSLVEITYYLDAGPPVTKSILLDRYSTYTVHVQDFAEGVGPGRAVSARVRVVFGDPIVVERPIYFDYGPGIDSGHTVMGFVP